MRVARGPVGCRGWSARYGAKRRLLAWTVSLTCVLVPLAGCAAGPEYPKRVPAAASKIIGLWGGANGPNIDIQADGTFVVNNWQDMGGSSSQLPSGHGLGSWKIEAGGTGGLPPLVLLLYKGGSESELLSDELDLVLSSKGTYGVCLDVDPDSVCPDGVLSPSR